MKVSMVTSCGINLSKDFLNNLIKVKQDTFIKKRKLSEKVN